MKETLIKLVGEAQLMQLTITGTADYILAEIRCQTCLHWDNFCPDVEAGSCDQLDRLTTPDFFCGRWEDKE